MSCPNCKCTSCKPREPQGGMWDAVIDPNAPSPFSALEGIDAKAVERAIKAWTPEEKAEFYRKVEERTKPYRTGMRFPHK